MWSISEMSHQYMPSPFTQTLDNDFCMLVPADRFNVAGDTAFLLKQVTRRKSHYEQEQQAKQQTPTVEPESPTKEPEPQEPEP